MTCRPERSVSFFGVRPWLTPSTINVAVGGIESNFTVYTDGATGAGAGAGSATGSGCERTSAGRGEGRGRGAASTGAEVGTGATSSGESGSTMGAGVGWGWGAGVSERSCGKLTKMSGWLYQNHAPTTKTAAPTTTAAGRAAASTTKTHKRLSSVPEFRLSRGLSVPCTDATLSSPTVASLAGGTKADGAGGRRPRTGAGPGVEPPGPRRAQA